MALFGSSARERDWAQKLNAAESENLRLKEQILAMELDVSASQEKSMRMAETMRNWEQMLQNMGMPFG
ncbi:MAG: hypothetical protein LBU76_08675 [Azoarcus sp.]|jgi:hypothetical protein|nr:hypothetical protein [Azoarcus sp.]